MKGEEDLAHTMPQNKIVRDQSHPPNPETNTGMSRY